MARKGLLEKWRKAPKFSARKYNRCSICGRVGGYLRRFKLCRLCFRELVWQGMIPGVKKASW